MKRISYFLIPFVFLFTFSQPILAKSIPLNFKRGVPEVEVTINGTIRATFIIDTGADHVYIDKDFAEKNGLLSGGKMPMRPVQGAGDKLDAMQIFVKSLKVGDLEQHVVSTIAIDLKAVVQDTSKGMPDGVLGYSFLKNQAFVLDYADKSLTFDLDEVVFEDWRIVSLPITLDRHFIVVNTIVLNADEKDSVKTKMILDTGTSFTQFSLPLSKVLKFEDSVATVKINLDNKVTTSGVKTLVGDISSILKVMKNPDVNGILGTSFLLKRIVLIDYRHNQITFIAE